MSAIPTDERNLREINEYWTLQSIVFYQERVDLGYTPAFARAQALAYLRRKTHWDLPLAAGVLDTGIADKGRSPT